MTGTKEAMLKMCEASFQQHGISSVNCGPKPLQPFFIRTITQVNSNV